MNVWTRSFLHYGQKSYPAFSTLWRHEDDLCHCRPCVRQYSRQHISHCSHSPAWLIPTVLLSGYQASRSYKHPHILCLIQEGWRYIRPNAHYGTSAACMIRPAVMSHMLHDSSVSPGLAASLRPNCGSGAYCEDTGTSNASSLALCLCHVTRSCARPKSYFPGCINSMPHILCQGQSSTSKERA